MVIYKRDKKYNFVNGKSYFQYIYNIYLASHDNSRLYAFDNALYYENDQPTNIRFNFCT